MRDEDVFRLQNQAYCHHCKMFTQHRTEIGLTTNQTVPSLLLLFICDDCGMACVKDIKPVK